MIMNKAISYTLKLLAKKDYSEHEIGQKLKLHEFDEAQINETITFLKSKSFLDDKKFADSYFRNHSQRGKIRINAELARKGISKEIIAGLDAKMADNDQLGKAKEIAIKWLEKKRDKYQDKYKLKQNLFAKLSRQGFEYEVIMAVAEILESEGSYGFN